MDKKEPPHRRCTNLRQGALVRGSPRSERARRFLNKRLSFRECFMTPGGGMTRAGADVMRHLARKASMYNEVSHRSPITGAIDPLAMARQEGRRDNSEVVMDAHKTKTPRELRLRRGQERGRRRGLSSADPPAQARAVPSESA